MQALFDYLAEELDHDFKIRVDFDHQPAEPELGVEEDLTVNAVEILLAEGWVLKPNFEDHMDKSSIEGMCWELIKALDDWHREQDELEAELHGPLCEEEKLYENR